MKRKKYKRLRDALYEAEYTYKGLGEKLGRSKAYVTMRMTGKQPFSTVDMLQIGRILDIPIERLHEYFFDEMEMEVCSRI